LKPSKLNVGTTFTFLSKQQQCYAVSGHADVLRVLYDKLRTIIEAQSVARQMFESNALTPKELESIQAKRNEPCEAAERLLNIVMNQSSNVHSCFMEALKKTDQRHVWDIIVEGSYKGIGLCFTLPLLKPMFRC